MGSGHIWIYITLALVRYPICFDSRSGKHVRRSRHQTYRPTFPTNFWSLLAMCEISYNVSKDEALPVAMHTFSLCLC